MEMELFYDMPTECAADYSELKAQIESIPSTDLIWSYRITSVELAKEYRGEGIGKRIYEAALSLGTASEPIILVADRCFPGGSTSGDAMRVWNAVAERYLSKGLCMSSIPAGALREGHVPTLLRQVIRLLVERKSVYTKTIPANIADIYADDIRLYKKAVGKSVRGLVRVYSVTEDQRGVTIEMEYVLPQDRSRGAYRHLNNARYYALRCVGEGVECIEEAPDLTDEEYELAVEMLKDVNSAARFFEVDGPNMDTNPGNYGFLKRNGRMELVFFDFGHD